MNPLNKNLKLSSKGFSLIEVLIGVFILGSMGLIISQLSSSASVAFNGLEKSQVMSDSFEQLKATLKNNKACTANFLQGSGIGLNQQIAFGFHSYDSTTQTLDSNAFMAVGMENRGVLIKKMEILDKAPLGEATHMADIRITFTIKLNGNEQDYVRELPLVVVVKSGLITECWLKKDNRAMLTAQICLAMTDGALNAVDPTTGECVLAGGKWYTGDANSASCPDGILPAAANSNDNCNVILDPNFSETFPGVPVQMTDGTTATPHRPPYLRILDKAGKKCLCDWASDLALSAYAGAKCQIYCVAP